MVQEDRSRPFPQCRKLVEVPDRAKVDSDFGQVLQYRAFFPTHSGCERRALGRRCLHLRRARRIRTQALLPFRDDLRTRPRPLSLRHADHAPRPGGYAG